MNLKLHQPVRIAILECDTPLPKTKDKFQGYGGVFEVLLRSGAKALGRPDLDPETGLEISKWQVELEPERYPDPGTIDAILITGSSKYYATRGTGRLPCSLQCHSEEVMSRCTFS
jgi:hypothetical protein